MEWYMCKSACKIECDLIHWKTQDGWIKKRMREDIAKNVERHTEETINRRKIQPIWFDKQTWIWQVYARSIMRNKATTQQRRADEARRGRCCAGVSDA